LMLLAFVTAHYPPRLGAPPKLGAPPRLGARTRTFPPRMEFVKDLFAEPELPSVGGKVVLAVPKVFPSSLEQPASGGLKAATVTPWPDITATIMAPLDEGDLVRTLFVGVALALGPDFLLAPAGLVSDKGIRPGYALETVIGGLLTPDDQWFKDRREGLQASTPLQIRALMLLPFLAAGLLTNRLLLVALEDPSFVLSLGFIGCIGGGLLEVIREPLPTREERDRAARLSEEFLLFSGDGLAVGGRCHERDIVAAFRKFYPKYRFADMRRAADGESIPDDAIADKIREWNAQMGRPGVRTSSGYWKGISVARASEAQEQGQETSG